jgi:hypothetical protein
LVQLMKKNKQRVRLSYLLLCGIFFIPSIAVAQSSSTNYRVEESYFGSGGNVDASSTNYRARQSAGSLGVGDISSTNYRAVAGFNTPSEPFLEAGVTGASVDFGVLTSNTTSYASAQGGSCNCTFYVRSYLSSDYSVITASQPPTSESGNVIPAKSSQGAPSGSTSVAEFGINLVANTIPGAMGANPANVPDGTFADGKAATGYQTPNQYKYGVGNVIANSPATAGNQGIGQTNYTISYIMKIANLTPAGQYTMRHTIIAVATF